MNRLLRVALSTKYVWFLLFGWLWCFVFINIYVNAVIDIVCVVFDAIGSTKSEDLKDISWLHRIIAYYIYCRIIASEFQSFIIFQSLNWLNNWWILIWSWEKKQTHITFFIFIRCIWMKSVFHFLWVFMNFLEISFIFDTRVNPLLCISVFYQKKMLFTRFIKT